MEKIIEGTDIDFFFSHFKAVAFLLYDMKAVEKTFDEGEFVTCR